MAIRVTQGDGSASVATEQIGNDQYQRIKVVGGETGSTSVWGISPDGSAKVSVIGNANVVIVGGSIATSPAANQSVSGTVGASIIGTVPVVQSGTVISSISGTANVSGSVAAWLNSSDASVIGVQRGSIAVAIVSGSVAVATGNSSVMLLNSPNVIGSVATLQGTNPWIITGSVQGSFSPAGNQSVSGAVNVSGSVLLGSSNASVITTSQNSSIIAINAGSVVTVSQGSVITVLQAPSIVGTYAEDAAFAQNDKGVFVLGVRNDNMASVTSADLDYSQMAVGPVGENVVANAPITKWLQGTADLRVSSGGSVTVIAAQGSSVFTYITGVQVANMGSASVLVTLSGATSSIIAYTIAPAGGGSNIVYPNALKTNANAAFSASISGVASVLVSAQGFSARI